MDKIDIEDVLEWNNHPVTKILRSKLKFKEKDLLEDLVRKGKSSEQLHELVAELRTVEWVHSIEENDILLLTKEVINDGIRT